jgi:uncharacterized protein (TIGR02145 family)
MKTKFFNSLSPLSFRRGVGVRLLFVLLLSLPFGEGWGGVYAQDNGVTVGGLDASAGTVTFSVSWNRDNVPALWSDSVWVFVDYNDKGVMKRLPLLPGATLTATSAPGVGTVMEETGNNKGVWVTGNARTNGSFSATVQLLTNTPDVAGACVYASNYPPVGRYTALSALAFTGTPPYEIVLKDGGGVTTTMLVNSNTYTLPAGFTAESFSDKTGAQGVFTCLPPTTYTLSGSNVCLNGTVTLNLQGSQAGWTYLLYKGSAAVGSTQAGTGSALAFPDAATATGTFNYMVRRVSPAGAQCEEQVSNVRSITVTALPTITLLSGGTNQSVNSGTAITAIKYTTANASSVTVTGLPAGITGLWGSNTFTISGSSTVTGSKTYTVTTANSNGCTNATTSGTITVNVPMCGTSYTTGGVSTSYAASANMWVIGGATWSDRIVVAGGCSSMSTLTTSVYTTKEYKVDNGNYYYTWACATNGSNGGTNAALCPSGWHLPSQSDFAKIVDNCTAAGIINTWGYSGYVYQSGVNDTTTYGIYWSSTEVSSYAAYYLNYSSSNLDANKGAIKYMGYQVRCVK